MERVAGRVPPDMPPYVFGSWVTEASEAERAELERNSVGVLAKLHAIDVSGADAAFLDRPKYGKTPLDQHLAYQREYYDWAREGVRYPTVDRIFDWLEARRPADEGPSCLNWGDARIGNMLYQGVKPVAVLDWEMAALGAPEVDLAWMLYMHEFFRGLAEAAGIANVPDFMSRSAWRSSTRALGSRGAHLDYYEVFAALRYAIVSIRTTAAGSRSDRCPHPRTSRTG
jgi:aminoglycoside phosphotransferase (APT) family kinase protein